MALPGALVICAFNLAFYYQVLVIAGSAHNTWADRLVGIDRAIGVDDAARSRCLGDRRDSARRNGIRYCREAKSMRKIAYRDMKPGDAVHVSLRGGGSRKGFYLGVDDEPAGLIVVNVLLSRDNERWQEADSVCVLGST